MLRKLFSTILFIISLNVCGTELYMDSIQSTTGSQVSMPVYVNGFTDIISMQGSITFDASVISYLNVSSFNLPGMSISNFGTSQTGQGILTYSWYDASLQGVTVTDSTQLFSIDFTVLGASGQSSNISFSNTPISLEVVDNISALPTFNLTDGYIIVDYISFIEEKISTVYIFPNIVRENQDINIVGLLIGKTIAIFDANGKKSDNYNFKINKIRILEKGMFYLFIDGQIFKCLVI